MLFCSDLAQDTTLVVGGVVSLDSMDDVEMGWPQMTASFRNRFIQGRPKRPNSIDEYGVHTNRSSFISR